VARIREAIHVGTDVRQDILRDPPGDAGDGVRGAQGRFLRLHPATDFLGQPRNHCFECGQMFELEGEHWERAWMSTAQEIRRERMVTRRSGRSAKWCGPPHRG
jgi:hypothetical protein